MRAILIALAAAMVAVTTVAFFASDWRAEKQASERRTEGSNAKADISETSRSAGTDETSDSSRPEEPAAAGGGIQTVPWQTTIATINSQSDPARIVAAKLSAVLPTFPPDGQMETAQQIVKLQTDDDYTVAESLYFSPTAPEPVKRLVFEDLMNRPNALKLPILVRTVGQTGHPLHAEALDNLQLFVGRDVGDDPLLWQSAVEAKLAHQRMEQEAARASGP